MYVCMYVCMYACMHVCTLYLYMVLILWFYSFNLCIHSGINRNHFAILFAIVSLTSLLETSKYISSHVFNHMMKVYRVLFCLESSQVDQCTSGDLISREKNHI